MFTIPRCYMFAAQPSSPRRRRSSARLPPEQHETCQYMFKRERSPPSGFQPSPAFWDNLSKVELTRRALEELDRRDYEAAVNPRPICPHSHQPLTEPKKSSQPLTSADKYLCDCGASDLKDLKRSARYGGPDLSDLRGVCGRRVHCS